MQYNEPSNNEGTKRVCMMMLTPKVEPRKWGYSLDLKLYDDPWKITKKLTVSNLCRMSRLLVPKDMVVDLVIPVLRPRGLRETHIEKGTRIAIWDIDTKSLHYMMFKQWVSSGTYVFINNWMKDFIQRRGLKQGDEIGFLWDPYKNRFNFSVLVRA